MEDEEDEEAEAVGVLGVAAGAVDAGAGAGPRISLTHFTVIGWYDFAATMRPNRARARPPGIAALAVILRMIGSNSSNSNNNIDEEGAGEQAGRQAGRQAVEDLSEAYLNSGLTNLPRPLDSRNSSTAGKYAGISARRHN